MCTDLARSDGEHGPKLDLARSDHLHRDHLLGIARNPHALVEFQTCYAYKNEAMEDARLYLSIRLEPAMMIHCPSCKRMGNLPDEMLSTPHTVRCRKCLTRFSIGPGLTLPATEPRPQKMTEAAQGRFTGERPAPPDAATVSSGARIHDVPPVAIDPEGSHYELPTPTDDSTSRTGVLDDDESVVEIAAFPVDANDSSDEFGAYDGDPPSGEIAALSDVSADQPALGAVRRREARSLTPGASARPGF